MIGVRAVSISTARSLAKFLAGILTISGATLVWGQQITDDKARTPVEQQVTIDVLANDGLPKGAQAFVDIVKQPQHGTTDQGQGPGLIIYVPEKGFIGHDSFQYTVFFNQQQLNGVGTVNIDVFAGPDLTGDFPNRPSLSCPQQGRRCNLQARISVSDIGHRCACPTAASVYLSFDETLDSQDKKIGSFLVETLDVGGTQQIRFTKKGVSAEYGGGFLLIKLDSTTRLDEEDLSNNVVVGQLTFSK